MLVREIRGRKFPHECGSKLIGEVADDCPSVKMGAYFAHAVDEMDNDIPGVKFTLGDKTKTTKAAGIAAFEPLKANPYRMTMESRFSQ